MPNIIVADERRPTRCVARITSSHSWVVHLVETRLRTSSSKISAPPPAHLGGGDAPARDVVGVEQRRALFGRHAAAFEHAVENRLDIFHSGQLNFAFCQTRPRLIRRKRTLTTHTRPRP